MAGRSGGGGKDETSICEKQRQKGTVIVQGKVKKKGEGFKMI